MYYPKIRQKAFQQGTLEWENEGKTNLLYPCPNEVTGMKNVGSKLDFEKRRKMSH